MAGRFVDKRVIVTGASSGIGAAAARRFASEGARVVLVARRKEVLEAVGCEIGIRVSVVSPGPVDTEFFADHFENVTSLAFSQPMNTAEQVAERILACAFDGRCERAVPRLAGCVCTAGYILPGGRRLLRPWLERRGRARKERYIKSKTPCQLSHMASMRDASDGASNLR